MGIRIIERLKLKRTHFKIAHSIFAFLLLRIRFMDISILFFQARRQSEGRDSPLQPNVSYISNAANDQIGHCWKDLKCKVWDHPPIISLEVKLSH